MSVLHTEKLTKIYEGAADFASTKALDGIEINVDHGEFVGIMGASGSGKTTLLNLLSGIDTATSGKIEIEGKQIVDMNKDELAEFRRKKLGFVFQDFNLLDSLTVKENILLPMILDKRAPNEMEARVIEVMNILEIRPLVNKYPYHLSGGQQQRTAIARALVNRPAIIFADEPTGNLDSKSAAAVMKCFQTMNESTGATILMVTHDAFAASHCSRVIFMRDGKLFTELVKKNGRKEFFDSILDCLSVLGGERVDI